MKRFLISAVSAAAFLAFLSPSGLCQASAQLAGAQTYEHEDTRSLVQLVKDAAELVRTSGEAAFAEFRTPGSRWRAEETYIFVLDTNGNMLVHLDPSMEGRNQLALADVNGRPIIKGLLAAATNLPEKPEGWYHYQWPAPGTLVARWKSSYVRLVTVPSGKKYVVGSGMYNDRMERAFVVDMVKEAVAAVEKEGRAAFARFYDPTGPFLAKDAYIIVYEPNGVNLVHPVLPNVQGRNLIDAKDARSRPFVRDMIRAAETKGSAWVDYQWPKPGEGVATEKSTYVSKAKIGDEWVMVGCGVYLVDAPRATSTAHKTTASELMALVRDAARVFEKEGELAYPEFRRRGSRWLQDSTYFFVLTMDGTQAFHAAEQGGEGENEAATIDALGRPFGRRMLERAASPSGEGWVHYMWPEPGNLYPTWKSTFVKRVTFPSGEPRVVGCGVYNMPLDRTLVEDLVNRAAALIRDQGRAAFEQLRDKTSPYVFMDTYVFVDTPDGIEVMNPAQPSIEGKNLIDVRDAKGKELVRDYISAAMNNGEAWVEYYWYRPGSNTQARKIAFVKKVRSGQDTYIVGSGYYPGEEEQKMSDVRKTAWSSIETDKLQEGITRQAIYGANGTVSNFKVDRGVAVPRHSHPNEEFLLVSTGSIEFTFDNREVIVNPGEVLVIPPNVPHAVMARADSTFVEFFAPSRDDWRRGDDKYLRK